MGYRVLVDRLWPRGLRKEALGFFVWEKEKDNARLNTKNSYGTRSVVLRTPGSSLTRARVTYLYSYGGLNTAGFTTQDYAVTPCFRIK